ncbi:hypothetical protein CEXT_238771 [Caerostris extrusa]|uniref:Uncharacterized protein n=1 Tax=Caerostris extrusa TaxID=172846 RepID=A0AAV4XM57_CAEEX|nr:hypothetical protein CEXT_238771 [Caerostris extrusa]
MVTIIVAYRRYDPWISFERRPHSERTQRNSPVSEITVRVAGLRQSRRPLCPPWRMPEDFLFAQLEER